MGLGIILLERIPVIWTKHHWKPCRSILLLVLVIVLLLHLLELVPTADSLIHHQVILVDYGTSHCVSKELGAGKLALK